MTYPPQGPYGQPPWGGYDPYGQQHGYPADPSQPYGQPNPYSQPYGGFDPYSRSPYGGHPGAAQQPPGYPPARASKTGGGQTPPPPRPPKNSNTGLIVSIVFAAVVLIGGGVTATILLTGDGEKGNPRAVTAQDRSPADDQQRTGTPPTEQDGQPTPSSRTAPATEIRRVTQLARTYAAALSGNSAAALAAITCTQPSSEEAAAFNALARESTFRFELLGKPTITGDLAKGKMRARDGTLTYRLLRTDSGWCADYSWQSLVKAG